MNKNFCFIIGALSVVKNMACKISKILKKLSNLYILQYIPIQAHYKQFTSTLRRLKNDKVCIHAHIAYIHIYMCMRVSCIHL